MTVEAFPFQWPEGQARTKRPQGSRFSVTPGKARDDLYNEIRLLGGSNVVISSDAPLRQDGKPYANRRAPDDQGVAVYFTKKERQLCFACDKWDALQDNVWAIKKTIEAIRGIERWSASDMMDRAFSGFVSLPAPGATDDWREVLGVKQDCTLQQVNFAYNRLRSTAHPDNGGSVDEFHRIQAAYNAARIEIA